MILASASLYQSVPAAAALLCYGCALVISKLTRHMTAVRMTVLACFFHALALASFFFQEQVRFGFAPALSLTAWLALVVYGLETRFQPQIKIQSAITLLAAGSSMAPLFYPGAVLHTHWPIWLPIHWSLGIASYGLMAIAVAHGWLLSYSEYQIRNALPPPTHLALLSLEKLTFRYVNLGFILLTLTLLIGALFHRLVPGPEHAFWGHKTVFSILAWFCFATLLLGRQIFGWRGQKAVRMLYAGSTLLLLAYVGSRFVLEAILGRTP